jgi:Big-like domain-containing protein
MKRVIAAALCCWVGVACGGDPDPAPAGHEQGGDDALSSTINQAPVIESVGLEPTNPRPGQRVTAHVEASDPDGDKIHYDYHWRVNGFDVGSAEGQPSLHVEKNEPGASIEVTVVAHDEAGESQPMTASTRVGNLPPTIVQVVMRPLGQVTAGSDVTASPMATDPDGNDIEYRYTWRVNGNQVGDGGPTLPASNFKRGDKIELTVVASDGTDDSEPLVSPPIEVANAAPHVVSQPGPIGADGVFRYKIQTEDPDGDKLFRYKLVKGPTGMTVGFDDGEMKWTPPTDKPGTADVEIEVDDRFGGTATHRFSLEYAFETKKESPPAKQADKASKRSARSSAPAEGEEADNF